MCNYYTAATQHYMCRWPVVSVVCGAGVLISVTGGVGMTLYEVDEVSCTATTATSHSHHHSHHRQPPLSITTLHRNHQPPPSTINHHAPATTTIHYHIHSHHPPCATLPFSPLPSTSPINLFASGCREDPHDSSSRRDHYFRRFFRQHFGRCY